MRRVCEGLFDSIASGVKGATIINAQDQTSERYHSYLLRLWQEQEIDVVPDDEPQVQWRCSLEEIGEEPCRHGFGSLEALMQFLESVLKDK
ncbi:MAG: hypothetical protein ACP5HM_12435 [Anaerolineae bacterium]